MKTAESQIPEYFLPLRISSVLRSSCGDINDICYPENSYQFFMREKSVT
jgi:hypothetical protein